MNETQCDVLIISVPYCEPLPLVAPVLLASCLEQNGISARGIDFNIEFLHEFANKNYWPELKNFLTMGHLVNDRLPRKAFREIMTWSRRFLKHAIDRHTPKVIGLSIFTSESLDFGLVLSYLLRRYHPDIKIVAGGKGLEVRGADGIYHYETWHQNNIADLIVVGDAEFTLADSLRENRKGLVYAERQSKKHLDLIPLPQWQHYELSAYVDFAHQHGNDIRTMEPYLAVTASKGCVRQCTFCDVQDFWPQYIYRDPVRVAQEIIHNYRATGIKNFRFTDNLINGSVSNYRTMNQHLVDEIPDTIRYRGYAIFRGRDQMPAEDFELAAKAGCELWHVGVESGSEKIRYEMRKKFDNQDLDWSANQLVQHNIQQAWLLMVGYPSETHADFEQTCELLRRYQRWAAGKQVLIQITPTFSMLPNSPLLKDLELAQYYGIEHLQNTDSSINRFWTSSRYPDNDFPTRSSRFKKLVQLTQDLGYTFGQGMPIQKWLSEIENLDRIYAEKHAKVFAIRQIA